MHADLKNGWCGIILDVNLTTGSITRCQLDRDDVRLFLGGRGLNAKTLFDRVPPGVDPLGPENILCMAPGILTATLLGLSSRLHVSTLSPYSGILGDGNAGGSFAYTLKRAGHDQIIISGQADTPLYLWIDDDQVGLLSADDLWGTSVWETTDRLTHGHGEDTSVACIGQAGENLVRLASTMVDKYASAARGSGAVWGSKRLKAIVVRGSQRVGLFDRKRFLSLAAADRKYLANDSVQREVAAVYGSHYGMVNWFPGFRNFQTELPGDAVPQALRPEAWKQYEVGRSGCQSCHIKCKNRYEIPSGRRRGERGEALEYEAIYCMGTNCGIDDPVAIMEMENLADLYGIDVIAIGNTWTCAIPLIWKADLWDGLAELLTAATGMAFSGTDIVDAADRIHAVERAFNIRQGITIDHDRLPQKPDIKYSPEGQRERKDHVEMLRRYYQAHGYHPDTGIPLQATLDRLNIPDVGRQIAADAPYAPWDGPPLWALDAYPSGGTRA